MSQITIHIHPKLAEELLGRGPEGGRAVAAVSRQAIRIVQVCGWSIAYAPLVLPRGAGCAMSARGGQRGLVIEIDQPGTLIAGRGVVREPKAPPRDGKGPRRLKRCNGRP